MVARQPHTSYSTQLISTIEYGCRANVECHTFIPLLLRLRVSRVELRQFPGMFTPPSSSAHDRNAVYLYYASMKRTPRTKPHDRALYPCGWWWTPRVRCGTWRKNTGIKRTGWQSPRVPSRLSSSALRVHGRGGRHRVEHGMRRRR